MAPRQVSLTYFCDKNGKKTYVILSGRSLMQYLIKAQVGNSTPNFAHFGG